MLVKFGVGVIRRRKEFIEELNGILEEVHTSLTGGKEKRQLYADRKKEILMMKNILALMLAILMILSLLTACGAKTDPRAEIAPAEEAGTDAAPDEESAEQEDAEQPAEAPALLPGGWAAADSPALTDEVLDAFSRAVEGLTSLIEPLMICFLAVIVGGIVIALFAPLVKMIDKLGG